MDIYKLSDFDKGDSKLFKITSLKQGVKNSNRVNVFVNDEYSFSLDVAQVVDFRLKVGQKITEEKLAELKKASEFGKIYQNTLKWVLERPRSVRETSDYLHRKVKKSSSDTLVSSRRHGRDFANSLLVSREMSSDDFFDLHNKIIDKLVSRGYLDDKKFAKWWVENRFVNKGVSKKRLEMELSKKGISREIISEVMNESKRNDADEIRKIIAKKRLKYDDEKLMAYLARQGFPYDLIKDLIEEVTN